MERKAEEIRSLREHLAMLEGINSKHPIEQRMWKAVEEIAEFTHSLARYAQEADLMKKELHREMIKGEMADAIIMIHHIAEKLNMYDDVLEQVKYKIKRQKEREKL